MTITAVRGELAARLGAIGGLRVYPYPPDSVSELPAAIIQPEEPLVEYDRTMGGSDASYRFSALLLTQSADEAQAWKELETYLNPSGAVRSRRRWRKRQRLEPVAPTGSGWYGRPEPGGSATTGLPTGASLF